MTIFQAKRNLEHSDLETQRLGSERIALTERIVHMRSQFAQSLRLERERLASEMFSRHENDEQTIQGLRLELTESNVEMEKERCELERKFRVEQRAKEQQRIMLRANQASAARVSREETFKLREDLMAVKAELANVQSQIKEREMVTKIIEKERDCLESQFQEEIRRTVSFYFIILYFLMHLF